MHGVRSYLPHTNGSPTVWREERDGTHTHAQGGKVRSSNKVARLSAMTWRCRGGTGDEITDMDRLVALGKFRKTITRIRGKPGSQASRQASHHKFGSDR